MKLTLSEINEVINSIILDIENPEATHAREDKLYIDFVRHVRDNSLDPSLVAMAKLLLTTQTIITKRWYE